MFADRGAVGVGTLEYQRRPEPSSLPVRLGPRPVALAGREGLLAELHARLADAGERPRPRAVVLCGLGGAGKTSVAVEYAHRHLAEAGVCWQFAAEDPTVLGAQFADLAAQLGVRELVDPRDPVASVHGVLARSEAGWLIVFDNVTDWASVQPFVPPAGRGRVLITTQNQHWPPGLALDVPVLDVAVAAGFLVSRSGDPDERAADELAGELGGLPLALEQAAAYIQATATTLAGYVSLFADHRADLLARGEAAGHPADVAATLGLALTACALHSPRQAPSLDRRNTPRASPAIAERSPGVLGSGSLGDGSRTLRAAEEPRSPCHAVWRCWVSGVAGGHGAQVPLQDLRPWRLRGSRRVNGPELLPARVCGGGHGRIARGGSDGPAPAGGSCPGGRRCRRPLRARS